MLRFSFLCLRPCSRTSFHHQPEAQHPKSSAIHKLLADYPILRHTTVRNDVRSDVSFWGISETVASGPNMTLVTQLGHYLAPQRGADVILTDAICCPGVGWASGCN